VRLCEGKLEMMTETESTRHLRGIGGLDQCLLALTQVAASCTTTTPVKVLSLGI
jgi:hypothetical protein